MRTQREMGKYTEVPLQEGQQDLSKGTLHEGNAGLWKKKCGHDYFIKKVYEFPFVFSRDVLHNIVEAYERFTLTGGLRSGEEPYYEAYTYLHEAFTERTMGEIFRFLLGEQQPKTRWIFKEKGLFIASRFVNSAKSLKDFLNYAENGIKSHNQFYLRFLPSIMLLRTVFRDRDFHYKQVLVSENFEAISIDFGRMCQGRRPKKYNLNFNEFDIRLIPEVGVVLGKGGVFSPDHWLDACLPLRISKLRTTRYISRLHYYDNDPRTYKNPEFLLEKHRTMLQLMMLPMEVFDLFIRRSQNELAHFFATESVLPERIADKFFDEVSASIEDLISVSAKIPEFLDYLANITLLELAEISNEIWKYLQANKKDKHIPLSSILGETAEAVFGKCADHLIEVLKNKPFGCEEKNMPFQLSLLCGKYRQEAIQFALAGSLQRSKSPLFELCRYEYLMKKGFPLNNGQKISGDFLLDLWDSLEELREYALLSEEILEGSNQLITHYEEVDIFMNDVLHHFTLPLFYQALSYIHDPFQHRKPIIPQNPPADPYLLLKIDGMTFQRILNQFFKHRENYYDNCLALNLQKKIENFREEQFKKLAREDYERLAQYASTGRSQNFTREILETFSFLDQRKTQEGLVRHAMEKARKAITNEVQQRAINFFDEFAGDAGFYEFHLEAIEGYMFHSLTQLKGMDAKRAFVSFFLNLTWDCDRFKKEIIEEDTASINKWSDYDTQKISTWGNTFKFFKIKGFPFENVLAASVKENQNDFSKLNGGN